MVIFQHISFRYTGFGTNNTPFLFQNLLLQNHKHVKFYNITTYSSTPYDILGEMFQVNLEIITPMLLPYQPHSSRHYFCWILYICIWICNYNISLCIKITLYIYFYILPFLLALGHECLPTELKLFLKHHNCENLFGCY